MILVTGGAGFIGSHLVDTLLAAGQEPVVLDNLASGDLANLPNGVKLVEMDVADTGVVGIIAELKPEVVIHAAAQVSVAVSKKNGTISTTILRKLPRSSRGFGSTLGGSPTVRTTSNRLSR